ncbi:hypothetical protein PVK06_036348 [Gossypium arboreum]|uniref:Uncharacterized protein n=1 Tax=Gossypium arboreum TaxID=29729 RepID=A0ABR0NLQ4_GOSAR|nr:hypothetical protein PVK06_036348 [Gossypium arboreum]
MDLKNKILEKAVKAFNPLRIRVEGSLQDQVVYNVRNNVENCQPFQKQDKDFLFSFSIGCLDMKIWDKLNKFFNQTQVKVTFDLNALIGRKESEIEKTLWVGDWYSHDARDLMSYTISKRYKIESYELRNNPDVVHRVQDPFFLTQIAQTFKDVSNVVDKFAPWSAAWVDESVGAYNSGSQLVPYTFAFGF